jgi:hypothetical protein
MTLDPARPDAAALQLAAQALGHRAGFAYAHLSPDLTITTTSPHFDRLAQTVTLGRSLFAALPEFVGLEADVADLRAGLTAEIRIARVNREQADGSLRYLDLSLVAFSQPEAGLLILIEDVSAIAALEQLVQQAHNDVRLLRRDLMRLQAAVERLASGPAGE